MKVNIPKLLSLGLGITLAQAQSKLLKGHVYINDENVGLPHYEVERETLRGAVIRCDKSTLVINELGTAIVRDPRRSLQSTV